MFYHERNCYIGFNFKNVKPFEKTIILYLIFYIFLSLSMFFFTVYLDSLVNYVRIDHREKAQPDQTPIIMYGAHVPKGIDHRQFFCIKQTFCACTEILFYFWFTHSINFLCWVPLNSESATPGQTTDRPLTQHWLDKYLWLNRSIL